MHFLAKPAIVKEGLFKLCQTHINRQLKTLQEIIASNQLALESETKSSAGDKHETGRAMIQLEIEKAGKQFEQLMQSAVSLAKISLEPSDQIKLGSLVITSKLNYFISQSFGLLEHTDIKVYAISPKSPIGNLLIAKKAGDSIFFNEEIQIQKVY